jgi:hypothetical protein
MDAEQNYHVTWEIDVTAKNPQDAAKKAWKMMRGHGSTANVFDVFDSDGEKTHVDLQEIKEDNNG